MSANHHYIDPTEKIWQFVANIVSDEGLSLYDLARPRAHTLRVFLDKPKVEEGKRGSGVTSGECSSVCKRLMHAFIVDGVELGLSAEPELEVSSPGLERELRLPMHFLSIIGSKLKIVSKERSLSGVLKDFSGEELLVEESEKTAPVRVNINDIKKAQLVF
jgi:ribosome maturation factor RimP